jgi:hypothetical protein
LVDKPLSGRIVVRPVNFHFGRHRIPGLNVTSAQNEGRRFVRISLGDGWFSSSTYHEREA